jgi:hypothetical protein
MAAMDSRGRREFPVRKAIKAIPVILDLRGQPELATVTIAAFQGQQGQPVRKAIKAIPAIPEQQVLRVLQVVTEQTEVRVCKVKSDLRGLRE